MRLEKLRKNIFHSFKSESSTCYFTNYVFFVCFSVSGAVCQFYFEFNVIFIDFYNICLTALRKKHKALQLPLLPGIGLSVSFAWKV